MSKTKQGISSNKHTQEQRDHYTNQHDSNNAASQANNNNNNANQLNPNNPNYKGRK